MSALGGAEGDLRSLSLHELLAAPLTAAMEAQQQASLSQLGFMQDVGFLGEGKDQRVNFVEFSYVREGVGEDGEPVKSDTRLRVPLLSLVSLPTLEIDGLEVRFLAEIRSVASLDVSPQLKVDRELRRRYPFLRGYGDLRVAPTSRSVSKGVDQTTRPYDLDVKLTASSTESTDGAQRVLTAMSGLMKEESG